MKGMNILSGKMPDYNHGDVRNRVFAMSQKLNMDELSTIVYLMNRRKWVYSSNKMEKLTFWQTLRYRISKVSKWE